MRDKRLKAELGIQYLKAHQKHKQKGADYKSIEKTYAQDHYKSANYGFDRNEKLYTDQLVRKI